MASALSLVNSPMAMTAREAFADPEGARKRVLQSGGQLPFCAHCREKPSSPYSIESVRSDIRILDPRRVVPSELVNQLTAWK
jgi:hypothetical protein